MSWRCCAVAQRALMAAVAVAGVRRAGGCVVCMHAFSTFFEIARDRMLRYDTVWWSWCVLCLFYGYSSMFDAKNRARKAFTASHLGHYRKMTATDVDTKT